MIKKQFGVVKKGFFVNRADPKYREIEKKVSIFKIVLSIAILIVALTLLICKVNLPFIVYLVFFVALFGLPAIFRKLLFKKHGIKNN